MQTCQHRSLDARVRAFGGGTARATMSLIDRALAGAEPDAAKTPRLTRTSAIAIVKLARTLAFESQDMARLFTADTDRAAAFLFAASMDGGCGPDSAAAVATWADALADAHATAMYHLRSQMWEHGSRALASGRTMDDVLAAAADDDTFARHAVRLRSRLSKLARRHVPACASVTAESPNPRARRVRWGHTAGRLPENSWARRSEDTHEFRAAVDGVVRDRAFDGSMVAARASFARGSIVAVAEFGDEMDVSAMIREPDLAEIRDVSKTPADLLVLATALRTTIAKNLWTPPPPPPHLQDDATPDATGDLEVYRDGGWFPWPGTPYEAARLLVTTTILDLDRVRSEHAWGREGFDAPFAAMSRSDVVLAMTRVADMLAASTYLCPLDRATRRRFGEWVVPCVPVKAAPSSARVAAAAIAAAQCASRLELGDVDSDDAAPAPASALYVPSEDSVGDDGDRTQQNHALRPLEPIVRHGSVLFTETAVEGTPPLTVRDVHEDLAPSGGAICYEFDRAGCGRWRMFANQARGAVHITKVLEYLGYRGFGRSSFLVEAYDAEGEFHGTKSAPIVAVVSYDRSRLEPPVAAEMDRLENLPPAHARFDRSIFPPYIVRGLRLTRSIVDLATDRVNPFPETAHDPPPPHSNIVSHAQIDGKYIYDFATAAATPPLTIDVEGWGRCADAYARSAVRAYWSDIECAACPHDMRMRLTRATTHVVFADGDGRAQSVRYAFSARTVRNVWDGNIAIAEERPDSIVYVVDNDLPGCHQRLVIVAGLVLCDVPMPTARMIETLWRRRGQTCPHASYHNTGCDGPADTDDGLVDRIDLDASDARAWLCREERMAAARTRG